MFERASGSMTKNEVGGLCADGREGMEEHGEDNERGRGGGDDTRRDETSEKGRLVVEVVGAVKDGRISWGLRKSTVVGYQRGLRQSFWAEL